MEVDSDCSLSASDEHNTLKEGLAGESSAGDGLPRCDLGLKLDLISGSPSFGFVDGGRNKARFSCISSLATVPPRLSSFDTHSARSSTRGAEAVVTGSGGLDGQNDLWVIDEDVEKSTVMVRKVKANGTTATVAKLSKPDRGLSAVWVDSKGELFVIVGRTLYKFDPTVDLSADPRMLRPLQQPDEANPMDPLNEQHPQNPQAQPQQGQGQEQQPEEANDEGPDRSVGPLAALSSSTADAEELEEMTEQVRRQTELNRRLRTVSEAPGSPDFGCQHLVPIVSWQQSISQVVFDSDSGTLYVHSLQESSSRLHTQDRFFALSTESGSMLEITPANIPQGSSFDLLSLSAHPLLGLLVWFEAPRPGAGPPRRRCSRLRKKEGGEEDEEEEETALFLSRVVPPRRRGGKARDMEDLLVVKRSWLLDLVGGEEEVLSAVTVVVGEESESGELVVGLTLVTRGMRLLLLREKRGGMPRGEGRYSEMEAVEVADFSHHLSAGGGGTRRSWEGEGGGRSPAWLRSVSSGQGDGEGGGDASVTEEMETGEEEGCSLLLLMKVSARGDLVLASDTQLFRVPSFTPGSHLPPRILLCDSLERSLCPRLPPPSFSSWESFLPSSLFSSLDKGLFRPLDFSALEKDEDEHAEGEEEHAAGSVRHPEDLPRRAGRRRRGRGVLPAASSSSSSSAQQVTEGIPAVPTVTGPITRSRAVALAVAMEKASERLAAQMREVSVEERGEEEGGEREDRHRADTSGRGNREGAGGGRSQALHLLPRPRAPRVLLKAPAGGLLGARGCKRRRPGCVPGGAGEWLQFAEVEGDEERRTLRALEMRERQRDRDIERKKGRRPPPLPSCPPVDALMLGRTEGCSVGVHKGILSRRSDFFERLFFGGFREAEESKDPRAVARLRTQLSQPALWVVRRLLYTGRLSLANLPPRETKTQTQTSLSVPMGVREREKRLERAQTGRDTKEEAPKLQQLQPSGVLKDQTRPSMHISPSGSVSPAPFPEFSGEGDASCRRRLLPLSPSSDARGGRRESSLLCPLEQPQPFGPAPSSRREETQRGGLLGDRKNPQWCTSPSHALSLHAALSSSLVRPQPPPHGQPPGLTARIPLSGSASPAVSPPPSRAPSECGDGVHRADTDMCRGGGGLASACAALTRVQGRPSGPDQGRGAGAEISLADRGETVQRQEVDEGEDEGEGNLRGAIESSHHAVLQEVFEFLHMIDCQWALDEAQLAVMERVDGGNAGLWLLWARASGFSDLADSVSVFVRENRGRIHVLQRRLLAAAWRLSSNSGAEAEGDGEGHVEERMEGGEEEEEDEEKSRVRKKSRRLPPPEREREETGEEEAEGEDEGMGADEEEEEEQEQEEEDEEDEEEDADAEEEEGEEEDDDQEDEEEEEEDEEQEEEEGEEEDEEMTD
uniref:BTB domain-containing protein n=1 Tax=Chromera velia CCMP2878 TaxID=1169474 RepID=A0A0G4HLG9_9ALVE|eukprot:Cvel_7341.t1-p1 / transcript=Cvel_7341.t1 / gene=Cvel_7341 / organism=Chromera_velia_CCMP2878 / gene_product=hypothetical protein / transcript_product=hypothetical protein / location=Cvel_scaffold380:72025-79241(-) / protein_length=1407 / sequence_SO=supercontig / SO=protein_coding / is_pseudo=false